MKFNFQFNNLLGTVYRQGDLVFSSDGNILFSPVGNKISLFDLRHHKSQTLEPDDSRSNISALDVSPDGCTLLAGNDEGEILFLSLISRSVLHRQRTNSSITAIKYSPDGQRFAVARDAIVYVYRTPGPYTRQYHGLGLERVLKGAYDDITSLCWSSCSRILAAGSKDMSTRLHALSPFLNFSLCALGGHAEALVNVFIEPDSLNCFTVSRNGHLAIWESSLEVAELVPGTRKIARQGQQKKEEESEDDMNPPSAEMKEEVDDPNRSKRVKYSRLARHFLKDALPDEDKNGWLCAADYHAKAAILVTGFTHGVFLIHEMPDCNLIHSLSIADHDISSVRINATGDWIAFGSANQGQLLVWEWQSETYVLKQQGHFNSMACLAYSPDGQNIATGGEDGKLKLWNANSGFSFVTFTEHKAAISDVAFTPNAKVVLSASLDGTVRAFDMKRYRNFKTFTSPRPAQFRCLSVDASGELVSAGGLDVFEIYLWSMKTGKLLEVISGHEGPVASLAFSLSPTSSMLASVSWDQTLRLWDALAVNSNNESVPLSSDATAVAFRPDGQQVAVATLNGQIQFFDPRSGTQTGTIEGKKDLGGGRSDTDLITAKKSSEGKCFMTLCYSADGSCLLAGGQSKFICIYYIQEKLLVKKFEVTQNRSFDAMDEVISRKKMSEFGNLALVEDRDDSLGSKTIALPGTKRGEMSSRSLRPEVRVMGLQFSPTGREFAAVTTEGLLLFSLDTKVFFSPIDMDENTRPDVIRQLILDQVFDQALIMALKLNDNALLIETIEQIPKEEIGLITQDLSEKFVPNLAKLVAQQIDTSRHLHFYALWAQGLLTNKAHLLRKGSNEIRPVLNSLHKSLILKSAKLNEISEHNLYTMRFLIAKAKQYRAKELKSANEEEAMEQGDPVENSDGSLTGSDDETGDGGFLSNWD
ncbi:hypothetical protein TCAL_08454 [Tigriopus californicus]|uniref:Small-subunit processome Utp12 domain-containing protein n=1 Tax=Tigriopus californicus TaxID=6832 RepID=A0A553P3J7_TIGCA|nr:periodic tryptophan protein 2 homolog [Tigriopus californicus]TRY72244.1 hypothetical protein TCAL_08454 [Tigriopus californicus]|eukprot:TCALIF_08454-PA protein Name:"Similar to PWP2 Periodic tryptophan protein 2 homolog (Pongo abelii)" AED:0.00 eAED:0.00 QI:0/-1/0/1/-1/1/1/0/927